MAGRLGRDDDQLSAIPRSDRPRGFGELVGRRLLLPALISVVGAVEIVAAGYDPVWLAVGTYLLAAAVLCAGRLAPLGVPLLVTAVYAATPLLGFDVSKPASWVPLIAFACLSTGLHTPRS